MRHDLLSPLTTISARNQLLARDIRRASLLRAEERTRMLVGVTAIEAAVQTLCAMIDAIGFPSRDAPADPSEGEG
jgi:signal transduction histidine kinase